VPSRDDDREVEWSHDDRTVLPDQTRDDTDEGWGERPRSRRRYNPDEQAMLDERPPHWG
jgi:hypothetical protein